MTDVRNYRLDYARWLRTGAWVPAQRADTRLEVKFNPYHDPANGQFTFAPGGAGGAVAGMALRPKRPTQRPGRAAPLADAEERTRRERAEVSDPRTLRTTRCTGFGQATR